ncbi:peptidase S58 DmpA [Sphingomonas sp. SRS2]|nr:peptidase S58 DmpA [Sphingomonas sp. SRS2]
MADTAPDPQDKLATVVNSGGKTMKFDWPMLKIGTAEYSEGPTGVTVFRFDHKVLAAVDVRGGGPGTVNTDWLRLSYDTPDLDAVVFSGGSWYGLENVTAVGTALKDDGVRTGMWDSIALSVGAIIYDFGDRRLNEIYPDKRLAQAAFHAVEAGTFRNGASGAGRMTRTGDFFKCKAHSGQGGAFRQIGDLKIAAFTVVNALGVVTDREGKVVACNPEAGWPKNLRTADLMAGLPGSRRGNWKGDLNAKRNTTVSLVVVNQKMPVAELQRLAVQVHTSMARGLQPFATLADGDVLYAVSTGEIDAPEGSAGLSSPEMGAVASEVMWDAILASVPEQPKPVPVVTVGKDEMRGWGAHAGDYRFSSYVSIRITEKGGKLFAHATGERDAFAISRATPVELKSAGPAMFTIPGRYPLLLKFERGGDLTVNPGSWQQSGKRQ